MALPITVTAETLWPTVNVAGFRGSKMDLFYARASELKTSSRQINELAKDNHRQLGSLQSLSCEQAPKLKALRIHFRGETAPVTAVVRQVNGGTDLNRYFTVLDIKPGPIAQSRHEIAYMWSFGPGGEGGGLRFETHPEWARSNPRADRFNDVAKIEVIDYDLKLALGCPTPAIPAEAVMSAGDDEVATAPR